MEANISAPLSPIFLGPLISVDHQAEADQARWRWIGNIFFYLHLLLILSLLCWLLLARWLHLSGCISKQQSDQLIDDVRNVTTFNRGTTSVKLNMARDDGRSDSKAVSFVTL